MSAYMLHVGDCRECMAAHQSDMFDACITDPPYELGFMGKAWDKRGISFDPETWRAVYRVLKPGARLLAFGAPRTHHRIWCAIEDAGFVIQDTVMWLFGQGFPNHRSKLKPAHEPICVARKGPVSELNIDEARIGTAKGVGRWPANVTLDERAAEVLDVQSGECSGGAWPAEHSTFGIGRGYRPRTQNGIRTEMGDSGGASRFFYTSKSSRSERNGEHGTNAHPTVKPVDLMCWLVRLVTQPGNSVLDPFAGSGTTGVACMQEGRAFTGIEKFYRPSVFTGRGTMHKTHALIVPIMDDHCLKVTESQQLHQNARNVRHTYLHITGSKFMTLPAVTCWICRACRAAARTPHPAVQSSPVHESAWTSHRRDNICPA